MLPTKFAVQSDTVGCVEYLHGYFVTKWEGEKIGERMRGNEDLGTRTTMKKITLLVGVPRITKLDTNSRWQIFLSLYRGRSTFAMFRHVMFRAKEIKEEDTFFYKVVVKVLRRLPYRYFVLHCSSFTHMPFDNL